jgi:recyclin-1
MQTHQNPQNQQRRCNQINFVLPSCPSNLSNGSDFNLYHTYASSLRQIRIIPYFTALKEVGHIFIIEEGQGKAVGSVVTDVIRFEGIFRAEEVYEFVQCRVDWAQIKRDVERALFGLGRDDCLVM